MRVEHRALSIPGFGQNGCFYTLLYIGTSVPSSWAPCLEALLSLCHISGFLCVLTDVCLAVGVTLLFCPKGSTLFTEFLCHRRIYFMASTI